MYFDPHQSFYNASPLYSGSLPTSLPLWKRSLKELTWQVRLPLEGFSSAYEAHFTSWEEKCISAPNPNVIFPWMHLKCATFAVQCLLCVFNKPCPCPLNAAYVGHAADWWTVILPVMVGEHTIDTRLLYDLVFSGLCLPMEACNASLMSQSKWQNACHISLTELYQRQSTNSFFSSFPSSGNTPLHLAVMMGHKGEKCLKIHQHMVYFCLPLCLSLRPS